MERERIIDLSIETEIDPKTITGYSYKAIEAVLLQRLYTKYPGHDFTYGKWDFIFHKDSFDLIVDDTYKLNFKYNSPSAQGMILWQKY